MRIEASLTESLVAEIIDGDIIELTAANFSAANGDLTVAYTHSKAPIYAQVEGGCLMELVDFIEIFTPQVNVERGYTAHTITATGTAVKADFIPVTYHDYPDYTQHTITARGAGVFVEFIHVDDIVT